jgi:anti-sigma factor RsiW
VTEHLSPAQLQNWRRSRLKPEELLRADDHLAQCPECRRHLETELNNSAFALYAGLAKDAPVGTHPAFEQYAAYVDGLMTGEERQTIVDHLSSCALCAPVEADLRAFRNEIANDLNREYRSETRAVAGGWRTRIKNALPEPLLKIPIWVYAAAPALLLFVLAWWIAWRSSPKDAPPRVAVTSPTPTPSSSVIPASPAPPTPEAANVLVKLKDGDLSLTLDSNGALTGVDQWPREYQLLARQALMNQRIEKSSLLAGLSRPGSSLMGGETVAKRFSAIEPAGKVTLTDRPTFHWSSLNGATGYLVEVYNAQFKLVASSPSLTSLNWTSTPLARGQVYLWQVKAMASDGQEYIAPRPPAPQVKFRILDQASNNEIAAARRDHASNLLMGLLYARAGLIVEAEQEFRALQKANPDSEVSRKLLSSVTSKRPKRSRRF